MIEAFRLFGEISLRGGEAVQSGLQGISNTTQRVSRSIDPVQRELNRLTRQFGPMTEEMRGTFTRMAEMMHEQHAQQRQHRQDLMANQLGWMELAVQSEDWGGTTEEFFARINELAAEQKRIQDEASAGNRLQLAGIYQQVGMLAQMKTESDRVIASYNQMGNPLYRANNGALRLTSSLERVARSGDIATTALRMLGPTANMKQLRDQMTLITQGTMRFQAVALASAVGVGIMFAGLHNMAMENKTYADSFNNMVTQVKGAMQPFIDVFIMIAVPVFNFISQVAVLIQHFNQAHPLLSKLIAGFLMLIPVLMLILSPLAIGIGLFNGFLVALNSVWLFISPLIVGFGAMSTTVMIVAGAIVALIAVGVLLYQNWDTVKAKLTIVWNWMKSAFRVLMNAFLNYTPLGNLIKFIIKNWDTIKTATKITWDMVKALFKLGVSSIKSALSPLTSWVSGVFNKIKSAMEGPIKKAKTTLLSIITAIKNAFARMKITIPKPRIPKISVSVGHKSIKGVDIPYPKFSMSWNKRGGFFDRATLFGAGEQGTELLMPVENKRYMKPFSMAVAENLKEVFAPMIHGGAVATNGGALSVEIPLNVNGREIARAIAINIDQEIKRQQLIKRRGV